MTKVWCVGVCQNINSTILGFSGAASWFIASPSLTHCDSSLFFYFFLLAVDVAAAVFCTQAGHRKKLAALHNIQMFLPAEVDASDDESGSGSESDSGSGSDSGSESDSGTGSGSESGSGSGSASSGDYDSRSSSVDGSSSS